MYIPKRLSIRNMMSHEETVYEFRNGKAIILIGKNNDSTNQKSNGSGKSGIIEGTVMAITGDSVRAVTMKELVRRGCESGEVEMVLENTMFRSELHLARKFYSGGKSAEVKIFENGVPIIKADVNEYNKWIWDAFGISKEDFFDFYVITKEYYKPFLVVGDTKKKEIINRFSGADVVDKVNPAIDDDSNVLFEKKMAIEKTLVACKAKQSLLCDQITEEKNKWSEEAKAEKITAMELELENLVHRAKLAEGQYKSTEILLKSSEDDLVKFNETKVDYTTKLAERKLTINNIAEAIGLLKAKLPLCKDKYIDEANDIRRREKLYDDARIECVETRKEAEEFVAELQKHLAGTITCPKCSHRFTLQSAEYTVEEAEEKLPVAEALITEMINDIADYRLKVSAMYDEKQAINKKVEDDQKTIRAEINGKDLDLDNANEDYRLTLRLEREQTNRWDLIDEDIKKYKRNLVTDKKKEEDLIKEAEDLDEKISVVEAGQSEDISKYENSLRLLMKEDEDLTAKLQTVVDEKTKVDEWYTNFKNFKSHLANQSIKNIADYTNLYLNSQGSDLTINIEGYKMMSNKKIKEQISTIVLQNGFEVGSYGKFSSGERSRIDISVILAIQTLINLNCASGGLDLTICDEIMDSVDTLGLESIVNALQSTERTIMIVSQNEINSLSEHTLKVEKTNGISKIVKSFS